MGIWGSYGFWLFPDVEPASRWCIYICIQVWYSYQVFWWGWTPCLSTVLHLLCRLSWEVHFPTIVPLFILNPFIRVLLATIRDKGLCPCPRCLTPKAKLDLMGRHNDSGPQKTLRTYMCDLVTRAHSFIYNKAIPIMGAAVEETLKPMSLVPTLVRVIWHTRNFSS